MSNISLWCDCAGDLAPVPRIHDMGILASTDPVAIDRASLDLIIQNVDNGTDELLEQIKNLTGENTIFAAEKHGIGTQDYDLIDMDDEPDEPDDSDYTILIIIICSVVAVLLIGGIVGFLIYKKKQNPNRETIGKISLINRSTEKNE